MKSPIYINPTANRHGTFLVNNPRLPSLIQAQLPLLLKHALGESNDNMERQGILQSLEESVQDRLSENILEDGPNEAFRLTQQEIHWMERHPKAKWLDYLCYRYKFKTYPRLKKLETFPLHLLIEPTSVCNLRCVMCFQVDLSFTRDEFMGFMPWKLFTDVVDQARDHGCAAITMASRGEPTLHKQFGEMLRYCADAGIMDIKINTNATMLTEKLCHDVLAAEVSEVVFSVDGGTKDTYEQIRVGGQFERVVENVERFNRIRSEQYPLSPTVTRISGVQVNEHQDIDQIARFWSQLVDQVTVKRATPRWDSYHNKPIEIQHACSPLWERMYVWFDGKANPCDFDYKSQLCVGDATTTLLSEIWLGNAYQRLREQHLERMRQHIVPCDRCPVY